MRTAIRFSMCTLLLWSLVGCGEVISPDESRRVGVIDFYDQPSVVAVPDTVRAGEEFEVSIVTYGNGCVSGDTTEVEVSDGLAEVVPYDLHSGEDVCPDVLRAIDHEAAVRFEEAGAAEVRIIGRRMPGNTLVVMVRPVVVEDT